MGSMLRGKRNRDGECVYGCCRAHGKRECRTTFRSREKREWKKDQRNN